MQIQPASFSTARKIHHSSSSSTAGSTMQTKTEDMWVFEALYPKVEGLMDTRHFIEHTDDTEFLVQFNKSINFCTENLYKDVFREF